MPFRLSVSTPMNSRGGNLVLAFNQQHHPHADPTNLATTEHAEIPALTCKRSLQGTNFYSQAGVTRIPEDTGHRPGRRWIVPRFLLEWLRVDERIDL